MRISDWSSDVCSSDLVPTIGHRQLGALTPADVRKVTDAVRAAGRTSTTAGYVHAVLVRSLKAAVREGPVVPDRVFLTEIGRASCRERVFPYVSITFVAVSLKKKHIKT